MATESVKHESIIGLDLKNMSDDELFEKKRKVANEFIREIMDLMNMCEAKNGHDEDIDRLRELIQWARSALGEFDIINRSKEKIWENRQQVIDRNLDFFLNADVGTKYIKPGDKDRKFIERIIHKVRSRHGIMNEKEFDRIWSIGNDMVRTVCEYMILNGEFS